MSKNDVAHANIRMPANLKNKIDKAAHEHGRSITSEIVTRLEESFNENVSPSSADSSIKIYKFTDMPQPAMTVEIPESVIGLMESNYHDLQIEQNQLNYTWVLKYHALRCTISEVDAQQLIQSGAKHIQ